MSLFGRPNSLSRFVLAARADCPDEAELTRALGSLLPPPGARLPFASPAPVAAAAAGKTATSLVVLKFGAGGLVAGALLSTAVAVVTAPVRRGPSASPATTISAKRAPSPSSLSRSADRDSVPERLPSEARGATDTEPATELRPPRVSVSATAKSGAMDVVPSAPGSVAAFTPSPEAREAVNVDAESRLIEEAREALHGDPARALSLAGEHARRFPSGLLAIEREVLAIHALHALGLSTEARQRLESLEAAHPDSIHLARLRRALGGTP